jgi:hypothetical protein
MPDDDVIVNGALNVWEWLCIKTALQFHTKDARAIIFAINFTKSSDEKI